MIQTGVNHRGQSSDVNWQICSILHRPNSKEKMMPASFFAKKVKARVLLLIHFSLLLYTVCPIFHGQSFFWPAFTSLSERSYSVMRALHADSHNSCCSCCSCYPWILLSLADGIFTMCLQVNTLFTPPFIIFHQRKHVVKRHFSLGVKLVWQSVCFPHTQKVS